VYFGIYVYMFGRIYSIWGGYDKYDPSNERSFLQISVSFIGLFCTRDL